MMEEKIKEYPIIFTGPMVKAILAGKKTMTRRIIRNQPSASVMWSEEQKAWYAEQPEHYNGHDKQFRLIKCPYGKPGDRLWVRETFLHATYVSLTESGDCQASRAPIVEYVADGAQPRFLYPGIGGSPYMQKRPSIFMPRWASRLILEVVSVRVERLQDITPEDARAEGMTDECRGSYYTPACDMPPEWWALPPGMDGPRAASEWLPNGSPRMREWKTRNNFIQTWCDINGLGSWYANPWVWCVSFRRIG
jgi:hypothetical protein